MSDRLWIHRRDEAEPEHTGWGWDVPATGEPDTSRIDELNRPDEPEDGSSSRGRLAALAALIGAGLTAVVIAGVLAVTGGLHFGGNDTSSGDGAGGAPPSLGGNNTSVGRIYSAASPAVASIRTSQGSGTGFLVSRDGTIVTNEHVVDGEDTVDVRFGDRGVNLDGRVLGVDASSDLAVVQVDPDQVSGVKPLRFGDSARVKVGDLAVAIGNPFALDRTATAGIVSATQREIRAPNGFSIDEVIQTDAPINPGNSGGPLLDARARVIGVNSQIAAAGGGGNVGIGFAVPAKTVKQVLPRLRAGQVVRRAFLGATTTAPSGGVTGAQVTRVQPGGPAAKAGMRKGDIVVSVGGKDVRAVSDVSRALDNRQPGQVIEVVVKRKDTPPISLDVQLGEQPRRSP